MANINERHLNLVYKKYLIHHTGMPFFCVWFGSVVAQIQLAFVAQGSIQLLRHKPHLAAAATGGRASHLSASAKLA